MVDKIAGTLVWNKAVAPNYTRGHAFFTNHAFEEKKRKKPVSLKHILDEAMKIVFMEPHFYFGIFSKTK